MNKYLYFIIIALFTHTSVLQANAVDVFKEYEKVIWIDQVKQVGIAYQDGKKLFEFPVVTGDDETTTNPGIYAVKLKDARLLLEYLRHTHALLNIFRS